MGYVVKHSTSNVNKTRRKGNVAIGVDSSGYDKTSVSGLYAGVPPVEGKHNFVQTSATGDPNFYCVDDTELINFANSIGGSVLTVLEAKNHLLQQSDIIFTDSLPKNKLTDGLRLNLNARIESSFLDNQPTTNLQPSGVAVGHNSGGYGNVVTVVDAPEKGQGWKKVTINNRGSNFRIIQWTYTSMAANTMYCHSIEFDWGNMRGKGYYIVFDGNGTGTRAYYRPGDYTNTGSTSIDATMPDGKFMGTIIHTASHNHAFFIDNNTTGVSGLDDYFYYKEYQVEIGSSPTSYTTGTRSQNTTWYDLSGYGNNFTPMVSMSFTGHSFDFNGVDSGVQDHISSYNPDGADSVLECLFKPMDLSQEQAIFSDNYGPEYGFWIHGNGTLRAVAYASVYANLTVGRWYHAVMNIDPGATKNSTDQTYVQLYLNGEYIGQSNANTGNGMNDQPFTLGYDYKGGSPAKYFSGSIAAASVYYGQFNQSEVSQNYYGGDIITNGLIFSTDAGNLVSYESGSTIAYNMTGSVSGSLINGINYKSSNGGAWDFDGTDEGIQFFTDFNLSSYSSLTYEGWIKGKGVTTLDRWFSGTNGTGNSSYHYPDLAVGPTGRLHYYFGSLGTSWANTGIDISTTEYNHIAFTFYTSGKVELFVNGSLVYTTTHTSGTFPSISRYMVGNRYDRNGEALLGEIAIVRTYNRALSASEVLQNYNAQKARFI